jgi:hypothetical protein
LGVKVVQSGGLGSDGDEEEGIDVCTLYAYQECVCSGALEDEWRDETDPYTGGIIIKVANGAPRAQHARPRVQKW